MRFIARFAKEVNKEIEIIDVFDKEVIKHKNYKTLSDKYPAAIWFERKIKDDFGIEFEGSFDKRELIHHERWPKVYPMLKSFNQKELNFSEFKEYPYEVVEGEGVFQVSVGPIHAGIIEPGHFHFSQAGEDILHLEVRHFYKYRGIEKLLESKSLFEAKEYMNKISGNEAIAYQIAFMEILFKAANRKIPLTLKKYYMFLLEFERIINHFVDLGFIPNDAGFAAALSFCSIKVEELRRKLFEITSHRFGFNAINFKKPKLDKSILEFLDYIKDELLFFEEFALDIPSLLDRLETTGILKHQKAIKYSTVGVVARASGVKIDRRDNDFYKSFGFRLVTQKNGDVLARFIQRIEEIKVSIEMMKNIFEEEAFEFKEELKINDGEYFSFVESHLGELMMYIDIKNQKIDRFFVRDASFVNWQALHLMMSGNIIADFPLINKSCDLSYAGNDL